MIPDLFHREQEGPDALREGFYLVQRRRADRVDVPVRIWFGLPVDPDNPGQVLDRSPRWQIEIAGVPFDGPLQFGGMGFNELTDFWPACGREPIDETEYFYRVEMRAWALEHDPDNALATPGGKICPMTATLPGM